MSANRPHSIFDHHAPAFMAKIMSEFGLSKTAAAAILGNLGHESNGFRAMQERAPTVKGSRGGWGIAQWTGKRRVAFEKWAKASGVDFSDLPGQMLYVIHELKTTEAKALANLKEAVKLRLPLNRLVEVFEQSYERAGVKHYPSRIAWARRALDAFEQAKAGPDPSALPIPTPVDAFDPANPIIVRGVQAALKRLGYPSVGIVDGLHGSRTSGAIAAFEHDRGAAKTGKIAQALIADLAKAEREGWQRPNAPERQSTTASDLRAGGSRIAQESYSEKIKGGAAAGGALVVGTVKAAGDQVEALQPVMAVLDAVPGWLWALIVIVMAVTSYIAAQRIERARVEDHRSGKTPGIGPVEYDYAVDPTSRVQDEQEIAE